ncbi:hypothetical protein LJB95_01010, partial [Paludibacteraceae bacterium OttesenSCG-928-F17]|nr:hypothetical protein [Paludibacteraceae bacterium OttesenSCG-928-F17]
MAPINKETLKKWFARGEKPSELHFAAWMDSYWHKEEGFPISAVQNLQNTLNEKITATDLANYQTKTEADDKYITVEAISSLITHTTGDSMEHVISQKAVTDLLTEVGDSNSNWFTSTTNTSSTSDTFNRTTLSPQDKTPKINDIILSASGYTYIVTSTASTTVTASRSISIKGAQGSQGVANIVQSLGQSTSSVMSQKAVTDAIDNAGINPGEGVVKFDNNDNVKLRYQTKIRSGNNNDLIGEKHIHQTIRLSELKVGDNIGFSYLIFDTSKKYTPGDENYSIECLNENTGDIWTIGLYDIGLIYIYSVSINGGAPVYDGFWANCNSTDTTWQQEYYSVGYERVIVTSITDNSENSSLFNASSFDVDFERNEVGSTDIHLNLKTNIDEKFDTHISVDTPNGTEKIAYITDLKDDVNIVQNTGTSTTSVMSQKAVTDLLAEVGGSNNWFTSTTNTSSTNYTFNRTTLSPQNKIPKVNDIILAASGYTFVITSVANTTVTASRSISIKGAQEVVNIVQSLGQSTTNVMSQKAVTDALFADEYETKIQIGNNAYADGECAITIGAGAGVDDNTGSGTGDYSISIGTFSTASLEYNTVIGYDAHSNAYEGVALGIGATVNEDGSIALGASSIVHSSDIDSNDMYGVLSIGNTDNFSRRIINVADGINDSDAATVGQLRDSSGKTGNNWFISTTNTSSSSYT